ncbi:MAG: hypothetical protein HY047_17625 [Acidobacteria bacterium]|nr:hypothetical protein [Acidobacteriota bacterium]
MTDIQRSMDRTEEEARGEPQKDQDPNFEPPTITKLGKLTRVVKASGSGNVTIGAGVG